MTLGNGKKFFACETKCIMSVWPQTVESCHKQPDRPTYTIYQFLFNHTGLHIFICQASLSNTLAVFVFYPPKTSIYFICMQRYGKQIISAREMIFFTIFTAKQMC